MDTPWENTDEYSLLICSMSPCKSCRETAKPITNETRVKKRRTETAWTETEIVSTSPNLWYHCFKLKINIQTKLTESIRQISREHFSNLTTWVFPLTKKVPRSWKKPEQNTKKRKSGFQSHHPLLQRPARRKHPCTNLILANGRGYPALEDIDLKMGVLISLKLYKACE